jgi:glycosyltransferase involved in cell wall biosynthesis
MNPHELEPGLEGRLDRRLAIAFLIPCLNEVAAIGKVVARVNAAVPGAKVYVFDNGSEDGTADAARSAGATVRSEPRRGKGNVIRRMFADVEADVYVLMDGDDTYDVSAVPPMIDMLIRQDLDMVTGRRIATSSGAYRGGHDFGNRAFTWAIGRMFGQGCDDVFSGLRVMTRRFVKSFPALATGFEIETDITVHSLALRTPIADYPVAYSDRPAGSASKLRTYRDGLRIMFRLLTLFRAGRPFIFYGLLGLFACAVSLAIGVRVVEDFIETGLVPRFPRAILATGLMLSGFISIVCGVTLQALSRFRHESFRLRYLSLPGLLASLDDTERGSKSTRTSHE